LASKYSVSLDKIINEFGLETIYLPCDASELSITSQEVNRPGLLLASNDKYFDPARVQYLGFSEFEFVKSCSKEKQRECIERLFSKQPSLVIITRSLEPLDGMVEFAEKYRVPILRTAEATSASMSTLIYFLGTALAPRITRHGVLVEVYGEGVLIVGDSGVGKSETAIELIKRGHRLIADDAVEIRKASAKTLVGSAPDNIRHFIELRGIGIINARRLFGMGAVKLTEKINMVIQLEPWDSSKVYDRMGLDNEYINIMDVKIPLTVVPVKPGRNLAVIIECAAMNNRQKKMGYNAARELLHHLGMDEGYEPKAQEIDIWQNY
jgi:HPr kinase/phosphorylase